MAEVQHDDLDHGGLTGIPSVAQVEAHRHGAFVITIDGGGEALAGGEVYDLPIPFACTLTGWTLLGNAVGSAVVDVWKDTLANFPPTDADSITGASPPTLTAEQFNSDSDIADWTGEVVAAGDVLRFHVDSSSGIGRLTISIEFSRDVA